MSHRQGLKARVLQNLLLVGLVVSALLACSEPPTLPEAKPLTTPELVRQQWPAYKPGPYAVQDSRLQLAEHEAWLWLPKAVSGDVIESPLLIFSHGNWADADRYGPLIEHWVSHGYTVAAVTHADGHSMARGIMASLRYGQMGLVNARVEDVSALLKQSAALKRHAVDYGVALDDQRIAIAGHSFGAFTAQQFTGAIADDGEVRSIVAEDTRIKAVVAVSPPGPMFDLIHAESWRNMRGPVLMTTGTWDVNAAFWPDWQAHRLSYDVAPAGQQYALVVEGADHYFGNLICRPERQVAPQWDALRVVNATSTSFLNAYVRGDARALAWLHSGGLGQDSQGFAQLLLK